MIERAAGYLLLFTHGSDLHHHVMANAFRNSSIALVFWMSTHKAPHPFGRCRQATTGALADDIKVLREPAELVLTNVLSSQKGQDNVHQTRETASCLTVDNLVQGQKTEFFFVKGKRVFALHTTSLVVASEASKRLRGPSVPPEPDEAVYHRVSLLSVVHGLRDEVEGNVKGKVVGDDGSGDKIHKDGEGRVVRVAKLHLHGSEFNAPSTVIAIRELEVNVLPDALKRRKNLHAIRVAMLRNITAREEEWVPGEDVREMRGEELIHSATH